MLQIGSQVVFPNTPHNRRELGCADEPGDFEFDVVYTIEGFDEEGDAYFYDGGGYHNFACSVGEYETV